MSTYKTLGIVIKRRNINEADRLLTVVTERRGKLSVIAKGARRPLSRLGSHLEPFNVVNFVMAEGRNFDIVTGAVVTYYWENIHNNLDKMVRASRFAELIDVLTHDKEENKKLFSLFTSCLDFLNKSQETYLIDLYFYANVLALLGYCPELYECVGCRGKIDPECIGWNHEHGGVMCGGCCEDKTKIDAEAIKLLRLFLEKGPQVVEQLKVNDELMGKVEILLSGFVNFINQKELHCDKFWQQIRQIGSVKFEVKEI